MFPYMHNWHHQHWRSGARSLLCCLGWSPLIRTILHLILVLLLGAIFSMLVMMISIFLSLTKVIFIVFLAGSFMDGYNYDGY